MIRCFMEGVCAENYERAISAKCKGLGLTERKLLEGSLGVTLFGNRNHTNRPATIWGIIV